MKRLLTTAIPVLQMHVAAGRMSTEASCANERSSTVKRDSRTRPACKINSRDSAHRIASSLGCCFAAHPQENITEAEGEPSRERSLSPSSFLLRSFSRWDFVLPSMALLSHGISLTPLTVVRHRISKTLGQPCWMTSAIGSAVVETAHPFL